MRGRALHDASVGVFPRRAECVTCCFCASVPFWQRLLTNCERKAKCAPVRRRVQWTGREAERRRPGVQGKGAVSHGAHQHGVREVREAECRVGGGELFVDDARRGCVHVCGVGASHTRRRVQAQGTNRAGPSRCAMQPAQFQGWLGDADWCGRAHSGIIHPRTHRIRRTPRGRSHRASRGPRTAERDRC